MYSIPVMRSAIPPLYHTLNNNHHVRYRRHDPQGRWRSLFLYVLRPCGMCNVSLSFFGSTEFG
jgi:hypothetical protein